MNRSGRSDEAPPKILYLVRETYPAYRADLVELFSNGVTRERLHIVWVMQAGEPQAGPKPESGPNETYRVCPRVPVRGVAGKAINAALAWLWDAAALARALGGGYAAIQLRDKYAIGPLVLLVCRLTGAKCFFWMSFPYPDADLRRVEYLRRELGLAKRVLYILRGRTTRRLLYRHILPRADHVFVQSDRMLADVVAEGIPCHKMTPVPMGVASARLPFSEEGPSHPHRAVYAGTLVRMRGIEFVIHAFARVREAICDAELMLIGDAPPADIEVLQREANELGVADALRFEGFLPQLELWKRIAECGVCLSPFRPDPILDSTSPTKVVEYLAMSRPVVVNAHPDQARLVHESGGGLVTPYDEQQYAAAIAQLMRDPERAAEMGRSGRRYVLAHRDYRGIAQRLACRYRELLGSTGGTIADWKTG